MENVANNTFKVVTTKQFGKLEIQVYENSAVGHNRAQDDFWMTRDQIGQALEYGTPRKAIQSIHDRNKDRLDPLSTVLKMRTLEGKRTVERDVICYNLRGVMEICRYSTQPKANSFIDFCWDVMTALMRGETVSLNPSGAEIKRQARFDQMVQNLGVIQSKIDALEEARRQDRSVIDNVLFVCKQLSEKVQAANQQPQPGSYTPRQNPKGRSEWRSEIYNLANKIAALSGLTLNCVLHQGYDYMGRNYGWYFKDERKNYIKKTGYQGSASNISGLDVIEASEMHKSIFMSIMKDRYENEKHDSEVKKGIKNSLVKKPPLIPLDAIPVRHPVEDVEVSPVVVAEAHAVEVEEQVAPVETEKPKKKYSSHKPSVFVPLIEPIAKKRGDTSSRFLRTYRDVYEIIGVDTMRRLERKYIKAHGKAPSPRTKMFEESARNMKVFTDALHKLDAIS